MVRGHESFIMMVSGAQQGSQTAFWTSCRRSHGGYNLAAVQSHLCQRGWWGCVVHIALPAATNMAAASWLASPQVAGLGGVQFGAPRVARMCVVGAGRPAVRCGSRPACPPTHSAVVSICASAAPAQACCHPLYPQLADPHMGRRVRAVFKPRVEGDAEGWHRAPIEWVAYELNLMLGMDYVPPVAYRQASGWERAVECAAVFLGPCLGVGAVICALRPAYLVGHPLD